MWSDRVASWRTTQRDKEQLQWQPWMSTALSRNENGGQRCDLGGREKICTKYILRSRTDIIESRWTTSNIRDQSEAPVIPTVRQRSEMETCKINIKIEKQRWPKIGDVNGSQSEEHDSVWDLMMKRNNMHAGIRQTTVYLDLSHE